MGVVFRARRSTDGDTVALKILREELGEDELYRGRFQREARIASRIAHDHVVPVVDYGESSGHLYIAARHVRGLSLAERIASEGALSLRETLKLVSDLAGALDVLHAHGLVHRDVKPGNVLIAESGSAALTDFGLARQASDTVLTKTGAVVGTLDYLAPEVIQAAPATPSSDIYALGCLTYECLVGTPPFGGRRYVETLVAHVRDAPPDPKGLRDDLPENLCWGLLTALAKDPVDRPPTARAYARLLRASAKTG
jgi:serine/threonine-protein kinase